MIITSKNPYPWIFTLILLAHTSLTPMTSDNIFDIEMEEAGNAFARQEGSRLFDEVSSLTKHDLILGSLVDYHTKLGKLFDTVCKLDNSPYSALLMDKLCQAFSDDLRGLQQALTHGNAHGSTPFMLAAAHKSSAPCVKIIIHALQEAFINDRKGLQEALTHQDNNGYTALLCAASKSTEATQIIIQALKKAFPCHPEKLDAALQHFNQFNYNALMLAHTQECKKIIKNAIRMAQLTMEWERHAFR